MIRPKERKYEEMRDLLEDLSTQIEEIREEFLSAIDDLEDKIAEVLQREYFANRCSLLINFKNVLDKGYNLIFRQLPGEKQNELMGGKQHFAEAAGIETK